MSSCSGGNKKQVSKEQRDEEGMERQERERKDDKNYKIYAQPLPLDWQCVTLVCDTSKLCVDDHCDKGKAVTMSYK